MKQNSDVTENNFCSRSCAVTVNNTKFPKRVSDVKFCSYCRIKLFVRRKYCSVQCRSNALTISREEVINRIKAFYRLYKRIPLKRELWGIYKPSRKYFGTWNKAITSAGFDPNPVLFANHHIAEDGHICDSMAEKIIDDYLYKKGIYHQRNIAYPEGMYTADFKVGCLFIEYFGLSGEHERYDELKNIKMSIAKRYNMKLISIYPNELYTHGWLESVLVKRIDNLKGKFIFGTKIVE